MEEPISINNFTCSICLNDIHELNKVQCSVCKSGVYHRECLGFWFYKKELVNIGISKVIYTDKDIINAIKYYETTNTNELITKYLKVILYIFLLHSFLYLNR